MTEAEVKGWLVAELNVPRETLSRLDAFFAFLRAENTVQNLVSQSTLDVAWTRHILDSAQLLRFAPDVPGSWLDLGTGAGFPGLIVAALSSAHVTMVEARPKRVEFLKKAATVLCLPEATEILCAKVETVPSQPVDVISARAFAPLPKLFALGSRFAHSKTRWILPKGKGAASELEAITPLWQGRFKVEPSLTDSEAGIIIADAVTERARGKRK